MCPNFVWSGTPLRRSFEIAQRSSDRMALVSIMISLSRTIHSSRLRSAYTSTPDHPDEVISGPERNAQLTSMLHEAGERCSVRKKQSYVIKPATTSASDGLYTRNLLQLQQHASIFRDSELSATFRFLQRRKSNHVRVKTYRTLQIGYCKAHATNLGRCQEAYR